MTPGRVSDLFHLGYTGYHELLAKRKRIRIPLVLKKNKHGEEVILHQKHL